MNNNHSIRTPTIFTSAQRFIQESRLSKVMFTALLLSGFYLLLLPTSGADASFGDKLNLDENFAVDDLPELDLTQSLLLSEVPREIEAQPNTLTNEVLELDLNQSLLLSKDSPVESPKSSDTVPKDFVSQTLPSPS